ncbi:maltose permease [Martiniozyma asiatica (nom. inval.)]|nr:maltose permease [Martiniozyma asiatica]
MENFNNSDSLEKVANNETIASDVSSQHYSSREEAPISWKTYLICGFTSFGGIYFGYDSGYISGVMGMTAFIETFTGKNPNDPDFILSSSDKSLITSILSVGTFFGAIIGGDIADFIGRRLTIIAGCFIFIVGAILQTASSTIALLAVGRVIAGLGVGTISSTIVLYMSEITPKKIRGAVVSGYQFCITIGLLLASCVDYGTKNFTNSAAYRIPIGLQMIWSITLFIGLLILPETPRFYVKKNRLDDAAKSLSFLRSQPVDSTYVQEELEEIVSNFHYEQSLIPTQTYIQSWLQCFKGGLRNPASNLRKTILGTSMQMMQQWTGINFIFYFGTTFFQQLGTISNEFLISIITTLVNVCSTPLSFYTIEKLGRRTILIYGAAGMLVCEFIVAIAGTVDGDNPKTVSAMIAFICIYIHFFASTWGPAPWVVVGEIFPLPIRARGVGLSISSNWLWNCIIAVITPYMVDSDQGNLGAKVFFIWGSLCTCCLVYAIFLVPETKGLTLEEIDRMLEETTPFTSGKWKPRRFVELDEEMGKPEITHVESV